MTTTNVMRRVITYQMNNILPTTKSDSDWHTDTHLYVYTSLDDTCLGLRAMYIIVIITHVYFTTSNIIIYYMCSLRRPVYTRRHTKRNPDFMASGIGDSRGRMRRGGDA